YYSNFVTCLQSYLCSILLSTDLPFLSSFCFLNYTTTTDIYTLSLHDALPISSCPITRRFRRSPPATSPASAAPHARARWPRPARSEEHTSELQSRFDLVCRLLLEKKKNENENDMF